MKSYVALGDFVLDIYHDKAMNLLGYYAGGSVWNDLLNISSLDPYVKCYSVATCGNDWAGDFILQIMNHAGIDTENVFRINKQTKRCNIVIDAENTKSQLECPHCHKSFWYSNTKLPKEMPYIFNTISEGIVIIDSLKKSVLDLAKSFRNHGWKIALDIGHISHLRYMSAVNAKALLSGVSDIVQLPNQVFQFLLNKFSYNNEEELFELLGCRYLNITDGERGSKFVFANDCGIINIKFCEAVPSQIIDPTGAGDAFFSKLLQLLDSKGNLTENIDVALNEARIYASNRISVLGANGKYKKITVPLNSCRICGGSAEKKYDSKLSRQRIAINTDYLLERTLQALDSNASLKLRKALESVNGHILMVGTGGSFAAAEFAAKCVTQYHPNAVAYAYHPRDIIIRGLSKVDAVILFSYSGKTKDIQRVYNLCQDKKVSVYVITKNER